ncbi:MAG: alanine racemase, partial [Maioricimonas sp. JB049]
ALSKKIRARYCTDNLSVARRISDYLVEHGATLELLAIVDTGQGRDGAVPSDIPGLAVELASLPGVTFGGILTHEGHAYKQTTPEALTNVAIEAGKTMVGLADEIRSRGVDVPTVSVGSTATAHIICNVAGITEFRPGGYPFYDYGQVALGTAEVSDCSAVVVARVVSSPAPGRALVDAGSNMLGTVALSSMIASDRDVFGLVLDRPGWDMHALSEEHGWLRWTGTGPVPRLEPGEQVAILPVHICFAFHAAGRSTLVREGRSIEVCTATARGHSL